MSRDRILQVITDNVVKVMPHVAREMVAAVTQLKELGANSIDRMDIVMGSMEDLQIDVPVVELGTAKDIETLVAVFQRYGGR